MLRRIFLSLLVVVFCSGCFVRLPTHGTPEMRARVGMTVPAKIDLTIFTCGDGNIAFEQTRENEPNLVGEGQRKIRTLPKGTPLRVKSMVTRRLWRGLSYYYVCRAQQQRLTFDVDIYDGDQFLDWSGKQAVGGSEKPHRFPSP